jgi:hypothetical protein
MNAVDSAGVRAASLTRSQDKRKARTDAVEAAQMRSGEQVLAGAKAVLADRAAGETAVRFALTRASEPLEEVLRIAASRGARSSRDG